MEVSKFMFEPQWSLRRHEACLGTYVGVQDYSDVEEEKGRVIGKEKEREKHQV